MASQLWVASGGAGPFIAAGVRGLLGSVSRVPQRPVCSGEEMTRIQTRACFASDLHVFAVGGELEGDVDDHVFLTAHIAGLADPLQDLMRRDAVARGRALCVQ